MKYCLSIAAVAAVVLGVQQVQASDTEHDVVWVWNSKCPVPTYVTLIVRFDEKTIFTQSLPLCHWERQFENSKTNFKFVPGRTLIWYGYRNDDGEKSSANMQFTIGFWQAGGEHDSIELGTSVLGSDNRIYMNTIHTLSPTQTETTTLAPGLIVETRPES